MSATSKPSPDAKESLSSFNDLGLPDALLTAVAELGYEQASPIQAEAIPPLIEGRDLLGQAQTGTGKTAAFALPLLSQLDVRNKATQLLILAPTRELAIQVAEACQQYAKHMRGINILPIYGGQSYTIQLKQLQRGAQVVVGTPGRVIDHMRRKTLSLDNLQALVLDEADEMLRMGFIDDVKWVLEKSPPGRQIALFSATMPREVRKVADQHLQNPVHIKIHSKTVTAANINQQYWIVKGTHKLDAITRILEHEVTDGVIVFVRTKNATQELADKLSARGFRCEALNGDIVQANREKIIDRLRNNKLDILIATDVVARGLDVERISHVINYDMPHDTEAYIHRIGRTGRAGRDGKAVLFVTPREKRMLHTIERATKQSIEAISLPSVDDINRGRVARFKEKIQQTINQQELDVFSEMVAELQQEGADLQQIAAASALLAQGDVPLLLSERKLREERHTSSDQRRGEHGSQRERGVDVKRRAPRDHDDKPAPRVKATALKNFPDIKMQRYQLDVGRQQQVKPSNIVGAIANEAGLDSQYIGEIEIRNGYTTVDMPADMPKEIMAILKKTHVAGRPLKIKHYKGGSSSQSAVAKPARKSYNSRKAKSSNKPTSDYAKRKRQARKKP